MRREKAEKIADALLTNAFDGVGTRLAIKQKRQHAKDDHFDGQCPTCGQTSHYDERDLGGRCREAIIDTILEAANG